MKHLYLGDYYYDVYDKTVKFIAGYRARRYFDGDDYSWECWPNLWDINCKSCIKKLLSKNREKIKNQQGWSVISLSLGIAGKDYTPETWPLIP